MSHILKASNKIFKFMKKVSYILVLIACLSIVSCSSPEKKALKLIDAHMFKTLYDYKSYEPVDTKIDSAFASVHYLNAAIVAAKQAKEKINSATELLEDAEHAFSSAEIWSDSYSSYGISQWKKYKTEYLEKMDESFKCAAESYEAMGIIRQLDSALTKEFIGWAVTHRYRANNRGGNSTIGDELFIIDPEFKEIIFTRDLDDDDEVSYHGYIDAALEMSDEEFQKKLQQYKSKN